MYKELKALPATIYKKLTEDLYDGLYFVNRDRKIILWNKRAEEITGYKKKEILGKQRYSSILQHMDRAGRKLCLTKYCPLWASINTGKPSMNRLYFRRKDGVRIPVDVHTMPIRLRGKIIGAIEIFRDASVYERMERQKEIAKEISLTDVLTGLPNRRYLNKELELEIRKFKKYEDDLYIAEADIDHFKRINDRFGHKAGDLVLRKISFLIQNNIRATDFAGRYGGEEFLIILPNTPKANSRIVLERIRRSIKNARVTNRISVTVSIGAAKAKAIDNPDTLFKRADSALYEAKRNGRNRIEYF